MPIDPVSSNPSDFIKALENFKATGEMEIPLKDKWKRIIQLKNDYPNMSNQEIADRVGYKTGQQVANELVKIRKWEKETGSKQLFDSPTINRASREIELIDTAKEEWRNDRAELVTLLHLVYEMAKKGMPFKGIQTRAGLTKEKFKELWGELNEAGFQEDGTLWRGMVMPKAIANRDFNGGDEVMSYLTYLSHNLDQVPSVEINVELAGEILVHAMAAIAIFQAQNKRYEVLESFKPYTVPKKHRNKENTNAALDILKHKDLIWEN